MIKCGYDDQGPSPRRHPHNKQDRVATAALSRHVLQHDGMFMQREGRRLDWGC
jgi:hypothetical protein